MTTSSDAATPQLPAELATEVSSIEIAAAELVIPCDATAGPPAAQEAADLRVAIKAAATRIHALLDPICEAAHQAHRKTTALRNAALQPLERATKQLDATLVRWARWQEEERRRLEAVEREAARKRAEEEQLARAAALEAQGRTAQAERVLAAPTMVVPQEVAAPVVPKGIRLAKAYTWRVVNPELIPDTFWVLDEARIGQLVRSQGEAAAELCPGIEVIETKSVRGA